MDNTNSFSIRLFEMFAGYGGASFALHKANIKFECIGISEIDKNAVKCFNLNFPGIKNFGDCSKIKAEDLPDFDLLTGGFPCQDVSLAGKRDLSKGRTNLYLEVLRIAKEKKPKYMLLENVKGLLSMEIDERALVNKIVNDLNKIGYSVCWKVLNSKDYGIPQNRERIWFVCKLGEWEFMEFQFPNKIKLEIFVKDILEKEVDEKYFLNDKQFNRLMEKNKNFSFRGNRLIDSDSKFFSTLSCGERYNDKLNDLRLLEHNKQIETSRYGTHIFQGIPDISPTLCHIGESDVARITLKDRIRKLTPKECFRLMGFLNDEINLNELSDNIKYKLAGNGWDINIASKIFKNMLKNETTKNN